MSIKISQPRKTKADLSAEALAKAEGWTFSEITAILSDAFFSGRKDVLTVFLEPMTLQKISQLITPKERVALAETHEYELGLQFLKENSLRTFDVRTPSDGPLRLQLLFSGIKSLQSYSIKVVGTRPSGYLDFQCEFCGTSTGTKHTCEHQWASYVMIWQCLTSSDENIALWDTKVQKMAAALKEALNASQGPVGPQVSALPANTKFESISLILDDRSLWHSPNLNDHLESDLSRYEHLEVKGDRDVLSPTLWNMPEVFRRNLTAYSGAQNYEVSEQTRLAGIVRYNFSNGMQISAKEILRHPGQKLIPKELLPQSRVGSSAFSVWPLSQRRSSQFVSQSLREIEDIIQSLLASIVHMHSQGKIPVFVESSTSMGRGIEINSIEYDAARIMYWRVGFAEKEDLETEFKLMSILKRDFSFYESFALEKETGTLVVHPWLLEFNQIKERVDEGDMSGDMPTVTVTGELESKSLLKYLRTRTLPVNVTGETQTLSASQSLLEVHLDEKAHFFIQHDARVPNQKNLLRKGWTPKTVLYLKTLDVGLPYLLNVDAKDIATRSRSRRDWDMKLLKHLGVIQYVLFETLYYHFEGSLSDGRIVEQEDIFPLIHENVQALLVSGSGVVLAKDAKLAELCSQSVLNTFDNFIDRTLELLGESESFYSEQGEVILEGIIEREFRFIYEILRKLAATSGGDVFKKSRSSFLSKIWTGNSEEDPALRKGVFHLPKLRKDSTEIHETLELLQGLIPHGIKIFYRGQGLQELGDNDFQVDFELTSNTTQGNFNWFELNPRFFLQGQEINPQQMKGFGSGGVIEYDGKLYLVPKKQMPSLRRLENFWQKLQKGKKESASKKWEDKVYQLPRHQMLELLALRASGYGIRGDEEWKKLCDFYDHMGTNTRTVNLPNTVKADLKPYQLTGVQWLQDLYNLKLGALLADDMGLGKTLQTLAFLEDLRFKGELGQVLVVVPSSLIYNWQSEVEKFVPKIPLTVFSNKDRDAVGKKLESKQDVVVITTYGLLMEHEDFLNQYNWKVLIFDEAQNLKNITTKRTSSARSLNAQFKICLTGTPMENHYGEFYSLVDILVPGSLGKIEDFRRQFVNTDIVSREQIDDLKLKIKPLLLRRTKKEILDQLPEKQETKVSIAFEEKQMQIYRDIALAYNQQVQESLLTQGEASVQLQMLTALLRLRQACSDPAALPKVKYDKVPPKLEALMDSITEIVESGESALVFTQFLQTLEHTEKLLKAAGVPVFVLHGGIPTKQRQKILSDFNKTEGGAVLVMTLKTGGVGLNLTKASYVFHIEPWWNPSVENQATDRAHRLGQSKAVQVFRYIMHESLEEKIELLKNRKDKKFQSLFGMPETEADLGPGSGALTKADFDLLLGLRS